MELSKYNQRHNTAYLMTQSLHVLLARWCTRISAEENIKKDVSYKCKYVTVQDDKQKNGLEILRTTPNYDRGQFSIYICE